MKAISKLTFIKHWLISLLVLLSINSHAQTYTVVLDAGHGGKDPGNRGNGYYEKDIALNIVKAVGKELSKDKNIKVIYTRKTDVFVELHNRAQIANNADADLFVSVHCDAHTSNAYGAATFALGLHENKRNLEIAKRENEVILLEDNYEERYQNYDPNNPIAVFGILDMQEAYLDQSLELASYIQSNFSEELKRKNRNVRQAGFLVLRNTAMPSVLIETGFLTNKSEGAYLNSKKGQKEMSHAIAEAIESYLDRLRKNTIVDVEPLIESTPVFKVQIASSKSEIATKPYNFKGLSPVHRVEVKPYFKYYLGETSDYNLAKDYLKEAKKVGYKSAFIVAFKNGERVSLKEVL
ncbi:MAG: N-acetylmuramoyl-L-alanine amidase family protein [Flavobacteriaceae bacterium]